MSRAGGVPPKGAKVTAQGRSCTTKATGRCAIRFGPSKPQRFVATVATVAHAGYAKGAVRLRVKR